MTVPVGPIDSNRSGPLADWYALVSDEINDSVEVRSPRSYTPVLTNVVVGTGGLADTLYTFIGGPNIGNQGVLYLEGRILLGSSGFSVSGTPLITLPDAFTNTQAYGPCGHAYLVDVSVPPGYLGRVFGFSARQIQILADDASSTYSRVASPTASIPFTWAAGDYMDFSCYIRATRIGAELS